MSKRVLGAEQLHAVEDHGSRRREQADRHHADQPVRPGVRLGLRELRSAPPLGHLVSLADLPAGSTTRVAARACSATGRSPGILAMQSGAGFTVTSGVDNARTGTGGSARRHHGRSRAADRSAERRRRSSRWFDTSVYAPNALGTFGNSPRNALRGPGIQERRSRPAQDVRDRAAAPRLQVRIEAFNVFNWVNLGTSDTRPELGELRPHSRAGARLAPRVMQGALRVSF